MEMTLSPLRRTNQRASLSRVSGSRMTLGVLTLRTGEQAVNTYSLLRSHLSCLLECRALIRKGPH